MTTHLTIKSWEELQHFHDRIAPDQKRRWPDGKRRWLYRGERCYCWTLRSSLERAVQRFGLDVTKHEEWEGKLLREFKRHLHRYTNDVPEDDDTARWLALMQHHGAPTRLLDFTYSFYAAVFFAIEDATFNDSSALWAIDHDWCWDQAKSQLPAAVIELLKRDSKGMESTTALLATNLPLAVPMNPLLLDERLSVQQGVFLCPLAINRPFTENLGVTPSDDGTGEVLKVELQCNPEFLSDALRHLHEMNISRVSLFPGVDGLARSLHHAIAMPWRFLDYSTWK